MQFIRGECLRPENEKNIKTIVKILFVRNLLPSPSLFVAARCRKKDSTADLPDSEEVLYYV